MTIKQSRQLHIRISQRCDLELKRIADFEGKSQAELIRQILWTFVRASRAEDGREGNETVVSSSSKTMARSTRLPSRRE